MDEVWHILAFAIVNCFLALHDAVEELLEEAQTVCETVLNRVPMEKGSAMLSAKEAPMKGT